MSTSTTLALQKLVQTATNYVCPCCGAMSMELQPHGNPIKVQKPQDISAAALSITSENTRSSAVKKEVNLVELTAAFDAMAKERKSTPQWIRMKENKEEQIRKLLRFAAEQGWEEERSKKAKEAEKLTADGMLSALENKFYFMMSEMKKLSKMHNDIFKTLDKFRDDIEKTQDQQVGDYEYVWQDKHTIHVAKLILQEMVR